MRYEMIKGGEIRVYQGMRYSVPEELICLMSNQVFHFHIRVQDASGKSITIGQHGLHHYQALMLRQKRSL